VAARSKARKRALDILFEAEQRGLSALPLLRDRLPVADPPISEYAVSLIEGVAAHQARIDELLSSYAIDWTLDRMPPVDRAVLRIAVFELLWVDDVPDAVVVSEAVELATALSTDESPRFINGMLGRMSDDKPLLVAPVAGPDEA
jgi:N utilization substance protein B